MSDNQGSVRLILTDTANDRRIRNYYCYDAFGESVISHEDVHNRFRFNGEQYDPMTSQYYLRARFYNPVIGRFTQEDTYYGDGLNLYGYCRNNPMLYRDPSGHDAVNQGSLYRKAKDASYIEPMPKKQLRRIVKAFKRQGGIIQMDETTDAYLKAKNAEAITLNENTILLRQKPGRASVFEELIHANQFRQGLNDGSVISRIKNEIAAQEMLLRNSKAYKLTPKEIKQTQAALKSYVEELQKLMGEK